MSPVLFPPNESRLGRVSLDRSVHAHSAKSSTESKPDGDNLADTDNPFASRRFDSFVFAPIRNTIFQKRMPFKSSIKHLKYAANPLKSAGYIQKLSPAPIDASELSLEECAYYTKQSHICRSNTSGLFCRNGSSRTAYYLSGLTTLHGGYDVHVSDCADAVREMEKTSKDARMFLQKKFPPAIKALIDRGKGTFNDRNTGLCLSLLFEHPSDADRPTVHIVFPGTGAGGNVASGLSADVAMVVGNTIPPSFHQARDIVAKIKQWIGDDATLELNGFSLGGAIATYAGMSNEVRTVTLCPMALSPVLWKNLIDQKRESIETIIQEKLTNLTIAGDMASGRNKLARSVRAVEAHLPLQMPHILGKTYHILKKDLPDSWNTWVIAATGYGIHASADQLWASLHYKMSLQKNAPSTIDELTRDVAYQPVTPAAISVYSSEYAFSVALDQFCKNASVISPRIISSREYLSVVAKAKELRKLYDDLDPTKKLSLLSELESALLATRRGNLLEMNMLPLLELYKNVIDERHRLQPPTEEARAVKSLALPVPLEQTERLFAGISEAAKSFRGTHTVRIDHIDSVKNAVFPYVLKTGDEIGPAIYTLVRNAKTNIRLQSYLFYEKSEMAKWFHRGLDELQQRKLREKTKNAGIEPVVVDVLLDDARGLARQSLLGNGGLFQEAKWLLGLKRNNRKNAISQYGIGYPAKLDPTCVRVTTKGLKHYFRGTLHSKVVVVDDTYSLICTNNFQGTHHKISMDGEARFDAGLVIAGDVAHAMQDDLAFIDAKARRNILGSNAREAPIPVEQGQRGLYSLPSAYHPAVYSRDIKPWELLCMNTEEEARKADELISKLSSFVSTERLQRDDRVLVLSRPPNDQLYARGGESVQRSAFLFAFEQARSYIRIAQTNLNAPEVLDALVAALKRDVLVEIVLPDDSMEFLSAIDAKTNCESFQWLRKEALACGKQQKLDLRWQASRMGHMMRDSGKTHAKYMNIDGVAFLGSANLDVQSWKYSSEVNIATAAPHIVEKLDEDCFLNLFRTGIPFIAN